MTSRLTKGTHNDQSSKEIERLAMLFRAFGKRDDYAFQRVAEAIISDQLAANHHAAAKELQVALGSLVRPPQKLQRSNGVKPLPRDRRNGEELITLLEPVRNIDQLILDESTDGQLMRVVDEHRHRLKLARHGYRPKSRLLFWGPPGCGKTLTAHYLADQFQLPVGLVRLSSVISSFLGDTAGHLQKIFDMSAETPMVLLLDEIDAIGKNRDDPNDVGELKRVVNSLLQAMDLHHPSEGLVIGASNHQYLLDSALWRRFDDVILFPPPGPKERGAFTKRMLSGVQYTGSFAELTKKSANLSYAALELVLREAVKTAILEDRDTLTAADIISQLRAHKDKLRAARKTVQSSRDES